MRLTPWRRLAILLTVLWIAVAGYARFRAAADGAAGQAAARFEACSETTAARAGDLGACLAAARRTREAARAGLWSDVAIGALAPPAAAWALFFLVVAAARWVWAGRSED